MTTTPQGPSNTTNVIDEVLRVLGELDPATSIARELRLLRGTDGTYHSTQRDPMMLLLLEVTRTTGHQPGQLEGAEPVLIELDAVNPAEFCTICLDTDTAIFLSLENEELGETANALRSAQRLAGITVKPEALDRVEHPEAVLALTRGYAVLLDEFQTEADGLLYDPRAQWQITVEDAVSTARANLRAIHKDLFGHPNVIAQLKVIAAGYGADTNDDTVATFVVDSFGEVPNPVPGIESDCDDSDGARRYNDLHTFVLAFQPEALTNVSLWETPVWVAEALCSCYPEIVLSEVYRGLETSTRDTAAKLFQPYGRDDMYQSYDVCVATARVLTF